MGEREGVQGGRVREGERGGGREEEGGRDEWMEGEERGGGDSCSFNFKVINPMPFL